MPVQRGRIRIARHDEKVGEVETPTQFGAACEWIASELAGGKR